MQNRTLYFGDNLNILQEKIPDESFDLVYLDPPFSSNRNYNVLFQEAKIDSSAQIRAFSDTWEWTTETDEVYQQLLRGNNPQVSMLTNALREFIGNQNPMLAYLVNMTVRILELHRVLKPTGSLYLHCDPTASHYLKIVLDVVFGKQNFRNEIIWFYKTGGASKRHFSKKHDVIFFYTKDENYLFNPQKEKSYMMHEYGFKKSEFFKDERGQYTWVLMKDVWEIPAIGSADKQRLGYPTQKPEELLERIILSSTNEGSWVLDPFCGCGTTVAVAERLNRNWIGVDISMMAINVIASRLKGHFPGLNIRFDGLPEDYGSAVKLAEQNKFAFQDWAITLVDALPPEGETRKGADRGVDGILLFNQILNGEVKLKKIIVQVKGGHVGRSDIATLKGDLDSHNAVMGVFITLNQPTKEMTREASEAGFYEYSTTEKFPRVQILAIEDWFRGTANVRIPSGRVDPFKKAEYKDISEQQGIF